MAVNKPSLDERESRALADIVPARRLHRFLIDVWNTGEWRDHAETWAEYRARFLPPCLDVPSPDDDGPGGLRIFIPDKEAG